MAVAIVTLEEQNRSILEKKLLCYHHILDTLADNDSVLDVATSPADSAHEVTCPSVWDGVLCWPSTLNGTVASLPCPAYVNGFKTGENASRTCTGDGTWWVHPDLNTTWTNLSQCLAQHPSGFGSDIPEIIAEHMGRIRLMYNIGYGVSLVALVLAVFVMLYFKRLHCPRNTIHINLFLSFILRASISFVKENSLVNGVGFPSDVRVTGVGKVEFLDNGSHWQCKTFFTLFNFLLGANYMWIFAEGLYLHMLITVAMFSEKSGIKRLILFGWASPFVFVIPWVIVRATLEDVLCWNTHPNNAYFWIIRGPIVAAMAINFIIFLNLLRVLFTKLTAFKTHDAKRHRYRKLAKSTLVLIPLFGVHYIVFIGLPDNVDQTTELVKLYYEMFFNSFQGFFVSLLFCFLNGEVQGEVRKKWGRFMLSRTGSFSRRPTRDTMTSFVSRTRLSTDSSHAYTEKDHHLGNGRVLKSSDECRNDNSDSNHSSGEQRNGSNGSVAESRPCVTSESHGSFQMTPLSSPTMVDKCFEESQPILNNNTGHELG